MDNEITFIKGLYYKEKRKEAPDYVLQVGSINHKQMIEFCQEQLALGELWSNYDILRPKDINKKPYAKLNTYKPNDKTEPTPPADVLSPSIPF